MAKIAPRAAYFLNEAFYRKDERHIAIIKDAVFSLCLSETLLDRTVIN